MPLSYAMRCGTDCHVPCPPLRDWRTLHTLFTILAKSECETWRWSKALLSYTSWCGSSSFWLVLWVAVKKTSSLHYRLLCIWEKGKKCYYASVGRALRYTVVVMFVCLYVCYSAARFSPWPQRIKQWVAMQLQLDILPPLNWLDFCFKALLASYSAMCWPWRPLSAIKSLAKSKLTTTNYLSP